MSATKAVTDAKAGWCSNCRREEHNMCASPKCSCPDKRRHRNHPDYASRDTRQGPPPMGVPSDARGRAPTETPKLKKPVWELVQADPPAPPEKPRKKTAVELARPLLEEIASSANSEWHRLAVFPAPRSAAQTRTRLSKAYSKADWEFRAASIPDVGQSALYVRWLGGGKEGAES